MIIIIMWPSTPNFVMSILISLFISTKDCFSNLINIWQMSWQSQNLNHIEYLVQLMKQPILVIPNLNFLNLSYCKVFFYVFNVKSCIRIFWCIVIYIYINLKLLPGKNTQKVNKQKIHCKNLGFVIRMWHWHQQMSLNSESLVSDWMYWKKLVTYS